MLALQPPVKQIPFLPHTVHISHRDALKESDDEHDSAGGVVVEQLEDVHPSLWTGKLHPLNTMSHVPPHSSETQYRRFKRNAHHKNENQYPCN